MGSNLDFGDALLGRSVRLLMLSLVVLYGGCKKKEAVRAKTTPEIVAEMCKKVSADPKSSPKEKEIAEIVLRKLEAPGLDPTPDLVAARYRPSKAGDEVPLLLVISDEDADIAGLRIKEKHKRAGGGMTELYEEYPAFVNKSIACTVLFVKIRWRNNAQKKNEQEWEEYVQRGGTWGKDPAPPIWISMASPPDVEVDVWVYDRAGNESNKMRLREEP